MEIEVDMTNYLSNSGKTYSLLCYLDIIAVNVKYLFKINFFNGGG